LRSSCRGVYCIYGTGGSWRFGRSMQGYARHAPRSPPGCPSALRPKPSAGALHHVMLRRIERRAPMRQFRLDFPYGSRVGFAHFSTSQVPPVTGGDSSDPLRGIQVLLLSLQPGRTSPHSPPGSVSPGGLFCFCESGRGSGGSKAWRGNSGGNVPLYVAPYDAIASCGSSRRSDP
jgi:hypothetical protein